MIERGLARLEPKTRQWSYRATVENLEPDDWSVVATAVGAAVRKERERS